MLVDSKEKKLDVEPIIVMAAGETNASEPAANVWAAIVSELNQKGVTLFQEGNTLFIVHHLGPREGSFRALNADVARNYLENSYLFIQAAHRFGYDILHSEFENPTILNIFKAISRNPPMPGMGYTVQETKNGYKVTLHLGHSRGE
jgi:hypothetical protein